MISFLQKLQMKKFILKLKLFPLQTNYWLTNQKQNNIFSNKTNVIRNIISNIEV